MQRFFLIIFFLLFHFLLMAQLSDIGHTRFDVQHYNFNIEIIDNYDRINGDAVITLRFLKNCNELQIDLSGMNAKGKGMKVASVKSDGNFQKFEHVNDMLIIQISAGAGDTKEYTINYKGIPADGLIISMNRYGHRTIFADNWPNRAHNWIPCVDHPGDKSLLSIISILKM